MALLGKILKQSIELRKTATSVVPKFKPLTQQRRTLARLLDKAQDTQFGKKYNFSEIIFSDNILERFKQTVPVFDYNSIHEKWWHRSLEGETDVCWPGTVKYYALSSGTSDSASKHIPITDDALKAIKRTSIKQILALANFDLPEELFEKDILMIGGSTSLNYNGSYYEGDLSGITAGKLPIWFRNFYKPGKEISLVKNWDEKLDEIMRNAGNWDIGIIVGVPAWIQIIMEKVIEHYKVENIHQVWPNLMIYVHGGVSFEPYKNGFEKLLGKPLTYIETYLASEGFIAFQSRSNTTSMQLVLNNGIYFEFVPFNESNFDGDGKIVQNPHVLNISQVREGEEYALLLSTKAGAWRYLIGDTIRFTDISRSEIVITGRTKHFLSLCGEHLSVDNMNKAVRSVGEELNINIKEFTVSGVAYGNLFAHQWFIGTDDAIDANVFRDKLDSKLCELNDDYKVERGHALKDVLVEIIPADVFYAWMKAKGKEGGQNKFPRVLKKEQLAEWQNFVKQHYV